MDIQKYIESNPDKIAFKYKIYKRWIILVEELFQSSDPSGNTPYIGEQRQARLYGSILFLAFALESFINEIGLEYCKDVFESIDRVSTPDKWILIPKILTVSCFRKDDEPFQSIVAIFKYRDLLVHFKPQFKKYSSKDYKRIREVNHKLVAKLYTQTIKAMIVISKELKLKDSDWLETKKIN